MKALELARLLKIPADQRRDLRDALKSLADQGKIVRGPKNRWSLPSPSHHKTGTLSVHPDGFGFVELAEPNTPDIFIPARAMGTALHGDRVQVQVKPRADRPARPRHVRAKKPSEESPERWSGRILRVEERKFNQLAGILRVTRQYSYVIPDHARIHQNIQIRSTAPEARSAGDLHRVVVDLLPWTDPAAPLYGHLAEDLGPADAPGVQVTALLRSHGLQETFPKTVEKSARSLQAGRAAGADLLRRDLRDECIFTIDPEDARDFDDAVSLTRTPDKLWQLSVHIADVAAYVPMDSPIDEESQLRGNSVYLVDRVVHMLPRHLTEEICSLNPHEDRLAHTVRMTLDTRGRLQSTETFPSTIRSAARLTYDQVQQYLDGSAPGTDLSEPVRSMLKQMQRLAGRLRAARARAGSVLFDLPEVRCVLDAEGRPTAIVPRRSYTAYHLIEEFMLSANRAVAGKLHAAGYPVPYRVHAPPSEEQWEAMRQELAALGIHHKIESRTDINQITAPVEGQPIARIVHLSVLRNMNQARYTAECAEHFGLAFDQYLHFTSPIRRYADLITHRVLCALEQGQPPPYSEEQVETIAAQCSRTERTAAEAEQASVDIKRLEYFADQLQQGHVGPYRALVTGTNRSGHWIELEDSLQRGWVSFSSMRTAPQRPSGRARGKKQDRITPAPWRIGSEVQVDMVRIDTARKCIDFRPAGPR